MKSVRIVGSGLIGTSIALALSHKGVSCQMVDSDHRAQDLAQDLVSPHNGHPVELVIFSTPLSALGDVMSHEFALNPQAGFIDVGSTKVKPRQVVDASVIPLSRFCLTHPMAGREIGGPESAQGDLFEGRVWVCDSRGVDADVVALVSELIEMCGAIKVEMFSDEHDQAVALISHLPQIISSLLAKQLNSGSEEALALAGSGLRDTVRIAASDPRLWAEIITANSSALKPLLISFARDLEELIGSLEDGRAIERIIDEGRKGKERIPGKHGGKARPYTYVPIVIDDRPGQLHKIMTECAHLNVNIEDLAIEHSPGQEKGLITLAVSAGDAQRISEHLKSQGWSVHSWRS